METNPNIDRLLEMLDHPEAFSEQEIQDIINHDDDTRAAYRLFAMSKQAIRCQQTGHSLDANEAWRRFEQKHYPQSGRRWVRAAASFAGIILISGIAFAAIHIVSQRQTPPTNEMVAVAEPAIAMPTDTLTTDTLAMQPIVYDNVSLGKMLQEIAAYYGVGDSKSPIRVTYRNEAARQLRFHFVWNRQQGIEKVVDDLNHFERLHVTLKDNQLIVE